MIYRNVIKMVGDFETTVYEGQTSTEVWASAIVPLFTDDVKIFHSIADTFEYLSYLDENIIIYYHNLKFDGVFWLSYLLKDLQYKQAITETNHEATIWTWDEDTDMKNKTFKYTISDMGQWYRILIKVNNKYIDIRDSLKLLPFAVRTIGKSFDTKHKKLDMEYSGYRYAGCEITEEEKKYIANDVLVVKEALEIMFNEGHDGFTIGSCCLKEFKKYYDKYEYAGMFPNLYKVPLDSSIYKYENADAWIRKSYKGGWCYLVPEKANKIYHNGVTADVNSLYPSMMSSESGNIYPLGKPTFWSGNYIPDEALKGARFYFVRIKTRFYIRDGMLPFIQIKGSPNYDCNECLETSDIYNPKTGEYCSKLIKDNQEIDIRPELTLTMIDFELLKEHYHLEDFEILDGCWFYAYPGYFDYYINKYKKIKLESKGAKRTLAKLFLNNLYGKMAMSTDSSFKVAYLNENNVINYFPVRANDKNPGYIAIGSAITSYARNFTIRAAQKNYHGPENPGFIYADTDSIHCDLPPSQINGISVDDKNFCCWKLESSWDYGLFVRQKTYIEHVVAEDLKEIDKPYLNIKCAGMSDRCKDLFKKSLDGYKPTDDDDYSEAEREFLSKKRSIRDFKVGLKVPGKLLPKRIPGGILLVETTYEMR